MDAIQAAHSSSDVSFTYYQKNMKNLYIRVKYGSLIQIMASTFFWVWSIINAIRIQFLDLGIITFLTLIIAGIFGQLSIRQVNLSNYKDKSNEERKGLKYSKYYFYGTIISHFLVTGNYTLGAIADRRADDNIGFVIYCIIFALIWAVTGWIFSNWAKQWMRGLEPSGQGLLKNDHLNTTEADNETIATNNVNPPDETWIN